MMKKMILLLSILVVSIFSYAQVVGDTYDNPMPLVLPLVDYMDTTEDYANDYAQEWFDPIAAYVSGNDFVGSFTLDSASYVSGSVTGLWTGLVIVDQEPTEADPVSMVVLLKTSISKQVAIASSWVLFPCSVRLLPLP